MLSTAFTNTQTANNNQIAIKVFNTSNKHDLIKSPFKIIENTKKHSKKKATKKAKSNVTTNQTQAQQHVEHYDSSFENAKNEIAQQESSGSYTAVNGKYYGKYQLDISYLHGDLSPENQEKTFINYCNSRYGSVQNALAFRQLHNWY